MATREWQELSTHDGTVYPVLLAWSWQPNWHAVVGILRADGIWGDADTGARMSMQPDVWMPLPDPPSASEEA